MIVDNEGVFYRYFSSSKQDKVWGVDTHSIGESIILPNTEYPPTQHPESYQLNTKTGRVLNEYQVIYISDGQGYFWSEPKGTIDVKAGSFILVSKGVRHHYEPDRNTGWHEHWIGFDGFYIDHLFQTLNCREYPVVIGCDPDTVREIFKNAIKRAKNESFPNKQRYSSNIVELLGLVYHHQQVPFEADLEVVDRCCQQIAENFSHNFDFEDFANENKMSYSKFRKIFKGRTQLPPQQYLIKIRLERAVSYLSNTNISIKAISEKCGFSSEFYFSRLFKKTFGKSPLNFRKEVLES